MPMHAYDADRDLRLYQKAEAAAQAGNQRMAEAIAKLERFNVEIEQARAAYESAKQQYAALERAIIEEAEEL